MDPPRIYWRPYVHPTSRPAPPRPPRPAVDRTAETIAWIVAERRRRYGPKSEVRP